MTLDILKNRVEIDKGLDKLSCLSLFIFLCFEGTRGDKNKILRTSGNCIALWKTLSIVKIAIIYLIFSKTSSSGHLSDWIRFEFIIKTLGRSGKYYPSSVWWISWTSKKRTIALSRISQKFWPCPCEIQIKMKFTLS